jgi:hypothetical protein
MISEKELEIINMKICIYNEILLLKEKMYNNPDDEVGNILYQQEINEMYELLKKVL